jgi:catalase
VRSYNKDGAMRYRHSGSQPVYAPNSYGGPRADPVRGADPTWSVRGEMVRSPYRLHAEDDDFGQAGTLWREVMNQTDRDHLVANIVGHASAGGVTGEMHARVIEYWTGVAPDLGARVARGLGIQSATRSVA